MISENESRAIKYIRVGSMLAIVICHILQSYLGKKLSAIMRMDWNPETVLKEVR